MKKSVFEIDFDIEPPVGGRVSAAPSDRADGHTCHLNFGLAQQSDKFSKGIPVELSQLFLSYVENSHLSLGKETLFQCDFSDTPNSPVMKSRFDQSVSGATMMMITSMGGLPSMFATMAIARAASN